MSCSAQGGVPVKVKEDDDILVRDPNYVKYERLLLQAEVEGRIDGRFSCLVCGMRYREKEFAEGCCRIGLWGARSSVQVSREDQPVLLRL
jgi:hypothetical protein